MLPLLANNLGLNSGEVSYNSYNTAQLDGALNCDYDSFQWNAKKRVVQMEIYEDKFSQNAHMMLNISYFLCISMYCA